MPLFLVPGDGSYEVQPVSVQDVAAICVDAGGKDGDLALDAAGPARWTFDELVRLIARAVGSRAWITHAPQWLGLRAAQIAGWALRDVLVTRDELSALAASLLVSGEEPRGHDRFDDWLAENSRRVGRRYISELARNFSA